METYRFYERVINSCKNHEQLQICLQWVRDTAPDIMWADLTNLIRAKAKSMMD